MAHSDVPVHPCAGVIVCVCGCIIGEGADGGGEKKGDSHFPLRLAWGRATGFNQPRMRVSVHAHTCTCECAHVSVSENPPTAGMETSLVMHLPLLVAADSPGHPYIGRVCRLLPIVHPSHSARPPLSSALSFPPSSVLHPPPRGKTKAAGRYS